MELKNYYDNLISKLKDNKEELHDKYSRAKSEIQGLSDIITRISARNEKLGQELLHNA